MIIFRQLYFQTEITEEKIEEYKKKEGNDETKENNVETDEKKVKTDEKRVKADKKKVKTEKKNVQTKKKNVRPNATARDAKQAEAIAAIERIYMYF